MWSNFNILHNSSMIIFPIQWCRVVFSICNSLRHSLYYYYYYYYKKIHLSFSRQCQLMIFHWCLSDSKSPQVYRTLLSILTNLNNAVVWIVSILPSTFPVFFPRFWVLFLLHELNLLAPSLLSFLCFLARYKYSLVFFYGPLGQQNLLD